jgi:hypothetical protein
MALPMLENTVLELEPISGTVPIAITRIDQRRSHKPHSFLEFVTPVGTINPPTAERESRNSDLR